MWTALDLTGQRFGRLVAEEIVGKSNRGSMLWKCQCECGKSHVVLASNLHNGRIKSCGCWKVISGRTRARTHGMVGTSIYGRWASMLKRTTNPNEPAWDNYGGRGITVCDSWRKFENFYEDMGSTFQSELELDRIDNDGPYSPENCRWATRKEQQRNRRNNHRLEVDGLSLTIQEWSERLGIKYATIHRRLILGWSVERALMPGDGRRLPRPVIK